MIEPRTFFRAKSEDEIIASYYYLKHRWHGSFPLTKLGWYIQYKHNKIICLDNGKVYMSAKTYDFEEVESPITEEMMQKECQSCRFVKFRTEFVFCNTMADKRRNICKKCMNRKYR